MESFDRGEFLEFFCDDAGNFIKELEQSLKSLKTEWDSGTFETCSRAAHSLTGAAAMMRLSIVSGLSESLERLLEFGRDQAGRGEGETCFQSLLEILSVLSLSIEKVCSEEGGEEDPADLDGWSEEVTKRFPDNAAEFLIPVEEARVEVEGRLPVADGDEAPEDGGPDESPPDVTVTAATEEELRKWLATGDSDLVDLLREEISDHLDTAGRWVQEINDLPMTHPTWGEVGRFFHTMAGSAATVGLDEFGERSRLIEESIELAAADPDKPVDDVRSAATTTLQAILAVIERRKAQVDVQLPQVDAETLADFRDESDDLFERIEDELVSLEGGADLGSTLEGVFRWIHTLKGISDTVGYTSLAAGAHRIEQQLDEVLQNPDDADSADFGERLLHAMDRLRHLGRAPRVADQEVQTIDDLLMGRAADQKTEEGEGAGVSATLRVPARRLDILMNLVGELVINRTRMALQLESLADLRGSLKSSQDRLVSLVEGYRQRYEFRDIEAQALSQESLDVSLGFSGMEFDRYDDLNILSRSLIEISTDTSEIMAELERIFGSFGAETESFQKITNTLQTEITRIRMVPVSRLFRRLSRPLRENARTEGKEVRLETFGGDVEIDRAVLERLYGCLVHLVRNAVAHGIETVEQRRSAGKSEVGLLQLTAFQEGDAVTITVHDDGRGLDPEKVKEAAAGLGLEADRSEIEQLIFRPGLSTRGASGKLAGRGMGLSAVHEVVSRLNGRTNVETTEGQGTTFSLTVPTTLAIHQALLVAVSDEIFALPLSGIDEVTTVRASHIQQTPEGPLLVLRGEAISFHVLANLVGSSSIDEGKPKEHPAVVVRAGNQRVALMVDRILAREEIVLKPLGRIFESHPFLSGAALAGDGSVNLVLELAGLLAQEHVLEPGIPTDTIKRPERKQLPLVLVVDDSLSVRRTAERLLESSGVEAVSARDGVEAIELMRQRRFDLVITDLEMPRLNGYELIATIRRNPETKDLPVVVLSSRASKKHRKHAASVGSTGYLTKPLSREDLVKWLPKPRVPS
ncbi:MAG: Hpt domain-containing protein [Acidobacteriota bacterium]